MSELPSDGHDVVHDVNGAVGRADIPRVRADKGTAVEVGVVAVGATGRSKRFAERLRLRRRRATHRTESRSDTQDVAGDGDDLVADPGVGLADGVGAGPNIVEVPEVLRVALAARVDVRAGLLNVGATVLSKSGSQATMTASAMFLAPFADDFKKIRLPGIAGLM
jgi:hypothetical protein